MHGAAGLADLISALGRPPECVQSRGQGPAAGRLRCLVPWDSNDSDEIDEAREALAALRQDARQQLTPVIVRVRGPKGFDERNDALLAKYISAAKEAVRLSGTEFVLEDMDLHRHPDMTWMLESTHDGALKLTSKLDPAFKVPKEIFYISFLDDKDLPQRIADLVRTRLRRIRYVWPYETKYPAVLRDLDFTPDRRARVQRISWMNRQRNEYEEDTSFEARIEAHRFQQVPVEPREGIPGERRRLVQLRSDEQHRLSRRHRTGTACELDLGGAAVRLHRPLRARVRGPGDRPAATAAATAGPAADLSADRGGLPSAMAQRELEEGAILWSDPTYMDETVTKIKAAGSFLDLLAAGGCDFNLGPIPVRFSLLMKLFRLVFKGPRCRRTSRWTARRRGGTGRPRAVSREPEAPLAICRVPRGKCAGQPPSPLEWEALDEIASRHFEQLGISDKPVGMNLGSPDGPLPSVVATHFEGVLKKATHDASLFVRRGTSESREPSGRSCTRKSCEHP